MACLASIQLMSQQVLKSWLTADPALITCSPHQKWMSLHFTLQRKGYLISRKTYCLVSSLLVSLHKSSVGGTRMQVREMWKQFRWNEKYPMIRLSCDFVLRACERKMQPFQDTVFFFLNTAVCRNNPSSSEKWLYMSTVKAAYYNPYFTITFFGCNFQWPK